MVRRYEPEAPWSISEQRPVLLPLNAEEDGEVEHSNGASSMTGRQRGGSRQKRDPPGPLATGGVEERPPAAAAKKIKHGRAHLRERKGNIHHLA